MKWKTISSDYLDYLRKTEPRIPYTNYGNNSMKPFFGVLFETDDFVYVTQISSIKPRHNSMNNNIDFLKLFDSRTNTPIGVINLNYMFPVPKNIIKGLEYKNIQNYRNFRNEIEKSKYINLLKIQLRELKKLPLEENSLKIYEDKYLYPDTILAKRCFDFKQLEINAKNWNNEI